MHCFLVLVRSGRPLDPDRGGRGGPARDARWVGPFLPYVSPGVR